ncbi:hypothetical protein C1O50_05720 [Akkermansia muciniphila]|nr:hypothetical protein C1O50_05720 [Akkermansia muciniphila]
MNNNFLVNTFIFPHHGNILKKNEGLLSYSVLFKEVVIIIIFSNYYIGLRIPNSLFKHKYIH